MSGSRVTAAVAIGVGVGIYLLAVAGGDSEAYLFPKLTGLAMVAFAAMLLIEQIYRPDTQEETANIPWRTIIPALVIFAAYVYVAEDLGFYVSSFIVFFLITSIYAPELRSLAGWIKRLAVSLAFIGAIYAIFGLLLKVQTPKGILI